MQDFSIIAHMFASEQKKLPAKERINGAPFPHFRGRSAVCFTYREKEAGCPGDNETRSPMCSSSSASPSSSV